MHVFRRPVSVTSMRLSPQAQTSFGLLQTAVKMAGLRLGRAVIRRATVDMVIDAGCRVAVRYLDEVVAEIDRMVTEQTERERAVS